MKVSHLHTNRRWIKKIVHGMEIEKILVVSFVCLYFYLILLSTTFYRRDTLWLQALFFDKYTLFLTHWVCSLLTHSHNNSKLRSSSVSVCLYVCCVCICYVDVLFRCSHSRKILSFIQIFLQSTLHCFGVQIHMQQSSRGREEKRERYANKNEQNLNISHTMLNHTHARTHS